MKQGTDQWFSERMGVLTASRFGDVLAGDKTKRHQQYVRELRLELRGAPEFDSSQPWHSHGTDMEPRGLGTYEWETGNEVTASGLIIHSQYPFIGCSPDGLIGTDGGVELKSRASLSAHIKCLKGMPAEHKPQVQGCLFVTGRDWWDFVSYYEKPYTRSASNIIIHRVLRDEKYIKRLEARCLETWEQVNG